MITDKIISHLNNKYEEFLNKFDKETSDKLKSNLYFAGGCIYSLANDKEPKDYDLFLFDDKLIEYLKSLDIWVFVSDYALSLGKFQVVTKYYGQPYFCVGQFDFKHNMHYFIPYSNRIKQAYEESEFEFLHTNELIFNSNRARDIEGVYLRIEKFLKRGMTISKETIKEVKSRTTKKQVKKYKKSYKSSGKSGRSYY